MIKKGFHEACPRCPCCGLHVHDGPCQQVSPDAAHPGPHGPQPCHGLLAEPPRAQEAAWPRRSPGDASPGDACRGAGGADWVSGHSRGAVGVALEGTSMTSPVHSDLLVDGADLERLVTGQHHD
ncbi:MAG: hypothetical protein ACLP70_21070, partial [Streptosporangiaceae bacterium]